MSELYIYSDDEGEHVSKNITKTNEDFIEKVTISSIKNQYSSFGLLTYYIKEPEELELDAAQSNLSCESYLYNLFLKASEESKNKLNSLS